MAYSVDTDPYDTDPYRRAWTGFVGSTGPTAAQTIMREREAWLPLPHGRIALSRIEWFKVRESGEWDHDMGGNRRWRGDGDFTIRAYWSDANDRYEDLAPHFTSEADALAWIDGVLLGLGDYTDGWAITSDLAPALRHFSHHRLPNAWLVSPDPEAVLRLSRLPDPAPTEEIIAP